ncbi:MAG: diaminopimelate epimerase [Bacteroidales bacterium]|nr:diaminopimelate epimerase [Bacteroidales bacterium]
MNEILFTKMHGISNDYVYINCLTSVPDNLPQLAIAMSDRHTGVGGDGIILILPSDVADFKMRMFNADGSEGKMCGNGIRCVGKYVYDYGLTDKRLITVETLAGIKTLSLHVRDGRVHSATVDMGEPIIDTAEVPVRFHADQMVNELIATSQGDVRLTAISMGNPHGVIFVDDLSKVDVHGLGRELETHPMWPDRANIEFAQVTAPEEITMRVWERGSGETMACGTGACALAVAAVLTGRTGRTVTIHLLGGDLKIEWGADGHVYMTGPAATVFEGRYLL